jgi:signal transduction histidine kinase
MEKPRWPWQQESSTPTTTPNLPDLAAKQTLDTLVAIRMRLELATGVPVAIFGPSGEHLSGISPAQVRPSEHHIPPAREVLAADQWPQHNGQLLAVTWGKTLHFFVTPVVVSDHLIAQVVLGPLQLFDPGKQDELASKQMTPRAKTLVGVPVLASWKAHAVAEIATIIVSLYTNQRSIEEDNRRHSLLKPPAREEATLLLPAIAQTGYYAPATHRHVESAACLGSLAESARLAEHPDTGLSARGQASSFATTQERMKLLGVLLEAMPQAVVIASAPNGQVILANRAARTLWPNLLGEPGSSPASSTKRIYLEDYPPAWAPLRQALHQGVTLYQGEINLESSTQKAAESPGTSPKGIRRRAVHGRNEAAPAPEGQDQATTPGPSELPFLVSTFPLRDASGEVLAAVATFEDISSLVERESFKDELVLRAAHDARNPLTIITSAAQLLERTLGHEGSSGVARERERRWLADIQNQTRLITELTEHLALLVRLQDAQRSPHCETFNLIRTVQQAIADQSTLAPERRFETTFETDPCLVEGSALQVEQILQHVLKNAVKYSPSETPISILVRCIPERAPLWTEISVRDQGVGIPRACLPHLFERWYQVPETRERKVLTAQTQPAREERSEGMSLYLCKQLIEHLGGQIWVESTEGHETIVKLLLPLKR